MLTAKKKISVREVVPTSEMATTMDRVKSFYAQYSRFIIGGVVLVAAIIVFAYIYSAGKAEEEADAGMQLRKVQVLIQQQQFKLAIDGDPAQGITGLKSIADTYSGTTSGETASLLLGTCYLNTEQYDLAIDAFDKASPSGDLLKSNAVAGKAAGYEGKKQFAEAAALFEDAAGMFTNDFLTASRYFSAARAWALSGNKEKAFAAIEKVREAKTPRFEKDVERLISQYDLEPEQ